MDIDTTMTSELNLTKALPNNEPSGLGAVFKAARESLGLSEKEAGLRLHLNPRIIELMESENFAEGPPATFMRGYIRSYARLLNVSPEVVSQAMARLESLIPQSPQPTAPPILDTKPLAKNRRVFQIATYLIILVLASLVAVWWTSHTKDKASSLTKDIAPAAATAAPVTSENIEVQPLKADTTPVDSGISATAAAPTQAESTTTTPQTTDTSIAPTTVQPQEAVKTTPPPITTPSVDNNKSMSDTEIAHSEPGLEQDDE